jgi:hypothetical protein
MAFCADFTDRGLAERAFDLGFCVAYMSAASREPTVLLSAGAGEHEGGLRACPFVPGLCRGQRGSGSCRRGRS